MPLQSPDEIDQPTKQSHSRDQADAARSGLVRGMDNSLSPKILGQHLDVALGGPVPVTAVAAWVCQREGKWKPPDPSPCVVLRHFQPGPGEECRIMTLAACTVQIRNVEAFLV